LIAYARLVGAPLTAEEADPQIERLAIQ